AHSARLQELLREQIGEAGGSVPFSRFMELALYAPGLGYYSAGASKFGAEGDFITAPELGPVFAACVAEAIAPVLQQIGPQARLLELGGGTGAFAEVALKRLLELDALPDRYAILEASAELRERQRDRLQQRLIPPVFELVEWLDAPFADDWEGVLFANEVIAMVRVLRPADAFLTNAVRHIERHLERRVPSGYRSEVLPQLPYWIQAVAGGLQRGAMLFVAYGHPRAEYYEPGRDDGTLRA